MSLAIQIEPDYLSSMPTMDAWGNPLLVASDSNSYAIRSVGSDGVAQDGTAEGPIGFESDIVFSNGGFTQWPQGLSPEVTEAL